MIQKTKVSFHDDENIAGDGPSTHLSLLQVCLPPRKRAGCSLTGGRARGLRHGVCVTYLIITLLFLGLLVLVGVEPVAPVFFVLTLSLIRWSAFGCFFLLHHVSKRIR